MTAQTVTGAVAVRDKQDQLVGWIRRQQDEIAMVAATHVKPSSVIRVTQGALRRNPKLLAAAIANPQSLLYALLDCARLGHEPDTDDYYLVPFGQEVTGIEGYKGIIERMFRAGGVSSVVAQVVRQRDRFASRGENTPPYHEYDPFASTEDRGPLRGAYSYAIFPDGRCSQVITMGRDEIMKHKAKSRGSDKADSPWQQWEESMWKKCPLRGLEPYVPTSTEYRRAVAAAGMPVPETVAQVRPDPQPAATAEPEPDAEIHDAEIVDEQPQQQSARPARAGRPTMSALAKLGKLLAQVRIGSPEDLAEWLTFQTGRAEAVTVDHLTKDETGMVTTILAEALSGAEGDGEEAASRLWTEYKQAAEEGTQDAGSDPGGDPDGDSE